MKKLSVEEEVKRGLIEAKYQYPATCTTFNKLGEVVATRTVTHNVAKTKELRKLYPSLKAEIDRITEDREAPYKPFSLGELGK